MRLYNKAALTTILISVSLIMVFIYLIFSGESEFKGWNEFEKKTISKYDFIKKVEIFDHGPSIFISYHLSRNADLEEVEKVFEETRNFILSKEVFNDMRKKHSERHGGTFGRIYINFNFLEDDEEIDYRFFSYCDKSGIPEYDSFKTWEVENYGITK